jgi:CBS domain containing-hemolysin-like protein
VSVLVAVSIVVVMIVGNALFVAVEFAFVSARRPAIEEAARAGDRGAARVVAGLDRLSFLLSIVQFGITATSLVVGILIDRTLGGVFVPVLAPLGLDPGLSGPVAAVAAFLVLTGAQMVLGELVPQMLAIARPELTARRLGRFALVSIALLGPVVRGFDRAATRVARRLFRVETPDTLEGGHTLDEVARIIVVSGASGRLTDRQTALLRRAVSLGDRRVGEVMVPRPDVVWLRATDTLEELRVAATASGHSRFPVHGTTEDDVLGTVHVKDLLSVPADDHASVRLDAVATTAVLVPESETLRQLLAVLQRRRRTFAVVIDEYGSTAGIVTIEDVLEALVGDITDEFDRARPRRVLRDGREVVPGSLGVSRFADAFGVPLPEGPYETIAGFVLDRLGVVPEVGARVRTEEVELEVAARSGMRITEIIVGRIAPTRVQVAALPADAGRSSGLDQEVGA